MSRADVVRRTMLYADLHDPRLEDKLTALAPVPGYCICVDIVGSTGLKQEGVPTWVRAFLEVFACAESCLYTKFPPLKSIGDALMFFIPVGQLRGETAASLFAACCAMAGERRVAPRTRIAVTLCQEAYPVSFLPAQLDYHGRDIDLTFRLLGLAGPREVVIEERFYQAVVTSAASGERAVEHLLKATRGPQLETLRGLPGQWPTYRYSGG